MKQGSVILRVHVYITLWLFYCSISQKTFNFYWTKKHICSTPFVEIGTFLTKQTHFFPVMT